MYIPTVLCMTIGYELLLYPGSFNIKSNYCIITQLVKVVHVGVLVEHCCI